MGVAIGLGVLSVLGLILLAWNDAHEAKLKAKYPPRERPAQKAPVRESVFDVIKRMEAKAAIDDGMQPERKELIEKMVEAGIFRKVEVPAQFPRAWTGPAFWLKTFDEKQNCVAIIYDYYIKVNPRATIVMLRDGMTGKDIGSYSASNPGLKMR